MSRFKNWYDLVIFNLSGTIREQNDKLCVCVCVCGPRRTEAACFANLFVILSGLGAFFIP